MTFHNKNKIHPKTNPTHCDGGSNSQLSCSSDNSLYDKFVNWWISTHRVLSINHFVLSKYNNNWQRTTCVWKDLAIIGHSFSHEKNPINDLLHIFQVMACLVAPIHIQETILIQHKSDPKNHVPKIVSFLWMHAKWSMILCMNPQNWNKHLMTA